MRSEVERAVDEYQRRAQLGDEVPLGDPPAMVGRVLRSITDLGPLTSCSRATTSKRSSSRVRGCRTSTPTGRLRGLAEPTSEDENRQIVDRLLAATERQLNAKHPIVQARVLDGTARLTAAIPPVADRLSATVRRYTVRDVTLDELVARDALSTEAAAFLWAMMQVRSRIVISGEPGAARRRSRLRCSRPEPARALRALLRGDPRARGAGAARRSYYEVRPPGLDGTGEIALRDLVKFVLAMRPDRIVVGEVRGAEAFELTSRDQRRAAASSARSTRTARPTR